MASPTGCEDGVMPMELAIQRELAFRARQIERGISLQSLLEFGFSSIPCSSDPQTPFLDSLLRERGLARKRLREATRKLACSRAVREVIPMDLAMQREKTFRRRLERGLPQPEERDSWDVATAYKRAAERWPLPQCQSRLADSSTCFQELPPSHDLSGAKKKAKLGDTTCSLPHRSHNAGRPHNQQSLSDQKRVGPFCNLCQVSCSSMFALRQHRQGKQHKAKQENLKSVRGKQITTFWCDVCCVSCSCQTALEQHIAGKKHAARLHNMDMKMTEARRPQI